MKVKTEITFDAAHRLVGYDGKCSNLHGHVWKVEVEIEGEKLDEIGILWDFANVKKIKKEFDHKTILKNCVDNLELIKVIRKCCGEDSVYLMKKNPTAENLVTEILKILKNENKDLRYKVRVFESKRSYAENESS